MKYTNAAFLLVTAATVVTSCDGKAYIFAQVNNKCNNWKDGSTSSLYAGYCVGCQAWKPVNECAVSRKPPLVAYDMPIRRDDTQSLASAFSQHVNIMPKHPTELNADQQLKPSTAPTLEDEKSDDTFVLLLIAVLLVLGVAVVVCKREKATVEEEGLKVERSTDNIPDLFPVLTISFDSDVTELENEYFQSVGEKIRFHGN